MLCYYISQLALHMFTAFWCWLCKTDDSCSSTKYYLHWSKCQHNTLRTSAMSAWD